MVLAEITDFILNVILLVKYFLKISIIIGKLLLETIIFTTGLVWSVLRTVCYFFVVFYEDYWYFLEDFKNGLDSIGQFFINSLSSVGELLISILNTTMNIVSAIHHGIEKLSSDFMAGRFLEGPIFTIEFAKQALIQIGSGVWFLVTLPGHIICNFWEISNAGLEIAVNASCHIGSILSGTSYRLVNYLIRDVPFESAAGLVILWLAYLFPNVTKKVGRFCFLIIRYLYRKMLPIGRGIRSKLNQFTDKIAQFFIRIIMKVLESFDFLQARANLIYDREVRGAVNFIRDFFSFSDLRRRASNLQARQTGIAHHHSREQNREQDLTDSSRSSSTSSERSTATEGSHIQESPTKRRNDTGPAIGLCIICEDLEKSVVLVPCGHLCLCKRCADQLGNYDRYCPICRTLIYRKVDVFI
ncbi:uncharacterized protein LOC129747971 [Uranotaenia lowii]|uniref:uncharacterized protein LOC129747971 n=1 Tax=Uranotaenia lowii TaxID=190385 RepID=UPI0024794525|nr:uncharacterized protein LOC129747971 [Uranotaenia lowii]